MAIMAMATMVSLAMSILFFSVSLMPKKSRAMSSEIEEDAARSWESAVDMVAARMPEKITPARRVARTPSLLRSREIFMMILWLSSGARSVMAPLAIIALPIKPMAIAINIEITTQLQAIRREALSLFGCSIAMKRRSTWGIPK